MNGVYNCYNQTCKSFCLNTGYEFTLFQQYGAVALLSFPLFFISGATSAVFWVIGKCILLYMNMS